MLHNEYKAHIFNVKLSAEHNSPDSPGSSAIPAHAALASTVGNGRGDRSLIWQAQPQQQGAPLLRDTLRFADLIIGADFACVSFRITDAYLSWLEISISRLGQPDLECTEKTIIKFSREAILAMELHEIDAILYEQKTAGRMSSICDHYFQLFIACNPSSLCSERLFVEDGRPILQQVKESLRSMTRFGVIMRSSNPSTLRGEFSSLSTRFSAEKTSNPLLPYLKFQKDRQARHGIRPQMLPKYSADPKASFFNWYDYCATMGTGMKIVWDAVEKDETEPFSSKMQIFRLEEEEDTKFVAIFWIPKGHKGNFSPGDKASAFLNLGRPQMNTVDSWDSDDDSNSTCSDDPISSSSSHSSPKNFSSQEELGISEYSNPFPPNGVAFAALERRWDKNEGKFRDQNKYPVTILENIPGDRQEMRANIRSLLDNARVFATIHPEPRHSIFPYVANGLKELNARNSRGVSEPVQQAAFDLLLSNRIDEVSRYDMYQSLGNRALAVEQDMNLNESQKAAVRLGDAAPAGFLSVQGPPGTGKTHWVVQAVKPFILDTTKQHRVLLTAAGNRGADSMASGLQDQLQELITEGKVPASRYVLRLHSIKTEKSIALSEATLSRQKILKAKTSSSSKSTTKTQSQQRSGQADAILAHCRTFSACKYEGVQDERVQHIEVSAGRKMLQLAGIKPDGSSEEKPHFKDFTKLYARYRKGEKFENEMWADFDEAVNDLLAYTINNATAICATVGGAADDTVTRNYRDAELIVVDEAARVPEYQWWPLLAFYPKAVGKIMVGDRDQLQPTVKEHDTVANPFEKQLEISLQERLQSAGLSSAFFNVQYRAVPQIAAIYSNACYQSRLLNDLSTEVENRELAQRIIEFNSRKYGISEPVVFYDISNATEGRAYNKSKFCKEYIILIFLILEDLLAAGFSTSATPCTIAILTPYKEEERVLRITKAKMAESKPDAANVMLETVDRVQGIEYDIVLVDPVVVKRPGFLTKNQLNVMFSRAKCGLYVVGDYESWSGLWRDDSIMLRRFASQLKKYRKHWNSTQRLSSRFFDPNILSDYDWE